MNRIFSIILLIAISFFFIILQSTLFSSTHLGAFYPDLNLILIIFLGLFSDVRRSAIIALGNGYMMDILSGYVLGIHSFSRFSVFIVINGISSHVYSQSRITQVIAIFFSTLFLWSFIRTAVKLKTGSDFGISLGDVIAQAIINTLVGLPIFWIIKRLHA